MYSYSHTNVIRTCALDNSKKVESRHWTEFYAAMQLYTKSEEYKKCHE